MGCWQSRQQYKIAVQAEGETGADADIYLWIGARPELGMRAGLGKKRYGTSASTFQNIGSGEFQIVDILGVLSFPNIICT